MNSVHNESHVLPLFFTFLHSGQYHLPFGIVLILKHLVWNHCIGQSLLSQPIISSDYRLPQRLCHVTLLDNVFYRPNIGKRLGFVHQGLPDNIDLLVKGTAHTRMKGISHFRRRPFDHRLYIIIPAGIYNLWFEQPFGDFLSASVVMRILATWGYRWIEKCWNRITIYLRT